ncbi:MAG: hypothetical protein WC763_06400, partial [Candidatus Paceibacterota bacterium]
MLTKLGNILTLRHPLVIMEEEAAASASAGFLADGNGGGGGGGDGSRGTMGGGGGGGGATLRPLLSSSSPSPLPHQPSDATLAKLASRVAMTEETRDKVMSLIEATSSSVSSANTTATFDTPVAAPSLIFPSSYPTSSSSPLPLPFSSPSSSFSPSSSSFSPARQTALRLPFNKKAGTIRVKTKQTTAATAFQSVPLHEREDEYSDVETASDIGDGGSDGMSSEGEVHQSSDDRHPDRRRSRSRDRMPSREESSRVQRRQQQQQWHRPSPQEQELGEAARDERLLLLPPRRRRAPMQRQQQQQQQHDRRVTSRRAAEERTDGSSSGDDDDDDDNEYEKRDWRRRDDEERKNAPLFQGRQERRRRERHVSQPRNDTSSRDDDDDSGRGNEQSRRIIHATAGNNRDVTVGTTADEKDRLSDAAHVDLLARISAQRAKFKAAIDEFGIGEGEKERHVSSSSSSCCCRCCNGAVLAFILVVVCIIAGIAIATAAAYYGSAAACKYNVACVAWYSPSSPWYNTHPVIAPVYVAAYMGREALAGSATAGRWAVGATSTLFSSFSMLSSSSPSSTAATTATVPASIGNEGGGIFLSPSAGGWKELFDHYHKHSVRSGIYAASAANQQCLTLLAEDKEIHKIELMRAVLLRFATCDFTDKQSFEENVDRFVGPVHPVI